MILNKLRIFSVVFSIFCCAFASGKRIQALKEVETLLTDKSVNQSDNEELTYGMLQGLLSKVDEYSDFFSPSDYKNFLSDSSGEFGGIGTEIIRHEEGVGIVAAVENSPAGIAGLKSGDIVTHIDGIEVKSMSLFRASQLMRGRVGTSVELTVKDKNRQIRILRVKRSKIALNSTQIVRQGKIPIIKIKFFNQKTYQDMLDNLKQLIKYSPIGLIIDLQNNPGGLLESSVDTASLFLSFNIKVVSIAQKNLPLHDILTSKEHFAPFSTLPIVVIVNSASASGAEVFASAMQDNNRAKVIGSKTYGKGVVQDVIPLKSIPYSAIKLTVANYYTPKGFAINKNGLIPDIACEINQASSEKVFKCDIIKIAEDVIRSYY